MYYILSLFDNFDEMVLDKENPKNSVWYYWLVKYLSWFLKVNETIKNGQIWDVAKSFILKWYFFQNKLWKIESIKSYVFEQKLLWLSGNYPWEF